MASQPRWTSQPIPDEVRPESSGSWANSKVGTVERLATSEPVHRGWIKWFSPRRRFGFIVNDRTREEIFFHQSNVRGPASFQLVSNQPVRYRVRMTFKGSEAYQIQPIDSEGSIPPANQPVAWSGVYGSRPTGTWCSGSVSVTQPYQLTSETKPQEQRSLRRFRCYNCGQYASHKAAFCPMEILQKCCYRCHSSTHLFADCPLQHTHYRKRVTANSQQLAAVTDPFARLSENNPDLTGPGSVLGRL